MIAEGARGDLLRKEAAIVVGRAPAAPVGTAGRIVLEIGAVDFAILPLIGRRGAIGGRVGLVLAFGTRIGIDDRRRADGNCGGGRRFVFTVGLFEQRVLLQHALD